MLNVIKKKYGDVRYKESPYFVSTDTGHMFIIVDDYRGSEDEVVKTYQIISLETGSAVHSNAPSIEQAIIDLEEYMSTKIYPVDLNVEIMFPRSK
jgi:hypothetical protein